MTSTSSLFQIQTLRLRQFRLQVSLGILEHERQLPQWIEIDAELRLQLPKDVHQQDDIQQVLDYRQVREHIIHECTAQHVDLLESLVARVAQRLLPLPTVLGVRLTITKPDIFDDCQVAFFIEAGTWQ